MVSGCAFLARQSSRIEYSGARIKLTSLASVSATFRWAAFVSTSSLNGGSNEEAIDIDAASRGEYHSDDRRLDYQRGAGADGPRTQERKNFWHRTAAESCVAAVFRQGLSGIPAEAGPGSI